MFRLASLVALVAALPALVHGARLKDGTYHITTTLMPTRYLTFPPNNRNATFAGMALPRTGRCQKWTVTTSATDTTWRTIECGGINLGYPDANSNTAVRPRKDDEFMHFNILNTTAESNTYLVRPYISRTVSVGHGQATVGTPAPAQFRDGDFTLKFTPA